MYKAASPEVRRWARALNLVKRPSGAGQSWRLTEAGEKLLQDEQL